MAREYVFLTCFNILNLPEGDEDRLESALRGICDVFRQGAVVGNVIGAKGD